MVVSIRRRKWGHEITDPRRKLELLLDEGVATLELTVRTVNALEADGILTIYDLLQRTTHELLSIDNFGARSLDEVLTSLERAEIVPRRPRMAKRGARGSVIKAAQLKKLLPEWISNLDIILANMEADDVGPEHLANLRWVLEYMKTGQEPAEIAGERPAATGEKASDGAAVEDEADANEDNEDDGEQEDEFDDELVDDEFEDEDAEDEDLDDLDDFDNFDAYDEDFDDEEDE